jgi:hypothetical protein
MNVVNASGAESTTTPANSTNDFAAFHVAKK